LKIIIDPDTKTATGVQFEKRGRKYVVKANKEVVLSAGSIASPQILMLSGVGPAYHLKEKGITPILDQPFVGENLHDHVGIIGMVFLIGTFEIEVINGIVFHCKFLLSFVIDKPYSVISTTRVMNLPVILNYTLFGGTTMSLLGGVEGLGFIKSKFADAADDSPDIQLHFGSGSEISDDGTAVRFAHGFSDELWNEYYKPIVNKDSWSVFPLFLHPKSRGNIRLNSNDPYDKPLINPNYFSDARDLEVTVEAVKFCLALSKTEALQKFNSKLYDKPFPGCEDQPLWTDDYWKCWIKRSSFTLAHTVGTCKMGPDSDPAAVVDPQLRFRGIKNLRVADTSIMPIVPSGNTNAPTVITIQVISLLSCMTSDFIFLDYGGRKGVRLD
jgi:glucose dehydrogenase (acceptor)